MGCIVHVSILRMFSVQNVGDLLKSRLPDDVDKIIIQQHRNNYIVMNVELSRIGIFRALNSVCETLNVDGVFTSDNTFHMIGDSVNPYPWPSRVINGTTLKAIRKSVRSMQYTISKKSQEIVRLILEIVCKFECSRFVPIVKGCEVSSMLVIEVDLYELHTLDLHYLISMLSEKNIPIKYVSFDGGKLELKISRSVEGNRGAKRGREVEENAISKKKKSNF